MLAYYQNMVTEAGIRNRPEATVFAVGLGVGVDSVAVLVELYKRGLRPDIITFANVGTCEGFGGEKPETYEYLPVLNDWLASVGFPTVTIVHKTGKHDSLYENCVENQTLPSLAFGRKGCSLKWKRAPQDKYMNNWAPARACWAAGYKVIKAIGYDCSPADSRRSTIADDAKYTYWYPLRDWGMTRPDCIATIQSVGLPVPVKSACHYCPATKKPELIQLVESHPELVMDAVAMEDAFRVGKNYRPPVWSQKLNRKTGQPVIDRKTGQPKWYWKKGTEGLGRNWAWGEWLREQGLMPGQQPERLAA